VVCWDVWSQGHGRLLSLRQVEEFPNGCLDRASAWAALELLGPAALMMAPADAFAFVEQPSSLKKSSYAAKPVGWDCGCRGIAPDAMLRTWGVYKKYVRRAADVFAAVSKAQDPSQAGT